MKWIGLTGGIASGKTTVANILKEMAVPIVDADKIAHQALKSEKEKITSYFGSGILDPNGHIDRKLLGQRVFSDEKSRGLLEGIVHPFVQNKVAEKRRLLSAAGNHWAVYDVPLLFENNLKDQFDWVLLVYAPEDLRLQRLMARNQLEKEEAQKRIDAQMKLEEKKKLADDVIENLGDLDELREKVVAWKEAIDSKYSSPESE